jgi:hypothetical protein
MPNPLDHYPIEAKLKKHLKCQQAKECIEVALLLQGQPSWNETKSDCSGQNGPTSMEQDRKDVVIRVE